MADLKVFEKESLSPAPDPSVHRWQVARLAF